MPGKAKYRRVLLKVSGEALMGGREYGLDPATVDRIAGEVKTVVEMGVQVCLVIGGGNIFRGVSGAAIGMERAASDYMGMLATVINSLAMQNALEKIGVDTRVQSAIPMATVSEPYIRRRAIRHMEKWREMGCDALMKGTKVDGVYSADPKKVKDAVRFDRLSYLDVLSKDLQVMDASAISLARESGIPILVFSIHTHGAFAEVVAGKGAYTIISEREQT